MISVDFWQGWTTMAVVAITLIALTKEKSVVKKRHYTKREKVIRWLRHHADKITGVLKTVNKGKK